MHILYKTHIVLCNLNNTAVDVRILVLILFPNVLICYQICSVAQADGSVAKPLCFRRCSR